VRIGQGGHGAGKCRTGEYHCFGKANAWARSWGI
jgi:hypothetical protein